MIQVEGSAGYYGDKLASLRDIFGSSRIALEGNSLRVADRQYPIVDDVIVVLSPHEYPTHLVRRLARATAATGAGSDVTFAAGIQSTFGQEWGAFPEILPDHEAEFRAYFDLIDIDSLAQTRVCDLGCGSGRWSHFLRQRCRELVLVDFSEAIFVARDNLRDCANAIFVMGDLTRLPFSADFAGLIICLGVLHHLPVPALDVVRHLGRYSPRLLVYLYYALDNRPIHYKLLLKAVTAVRRVTSRVHSPRLRSVIAWAGTLVIYSPLVALGSALRRVGMGHLVPLYEIYHGKSVGRMRQDVYDRFFTSIEQRFSRQQLLALRDAFQEVRISAGLPYWHFLCVRAGVSSADKTLAPTEGSLP